FVRKLALRIARRRLPAPAARELIARAVAARDPSEHVRMGLVELAAELGWSHGGAHLAILAGPDERSPKVRGAAAIALRTLAAASAAAEQHDDARAAAALLASIAEHDTATSPLVTACEELAALATSLATTAPALLTELAPGWQHALGRLL